MAILYIFIAIILIIILWYAVLYFKQFTNPLRFLPGDPIKLIRGTLVVDHSSEEFSQFDYYKQLRQKYGTIRRDSLQLCRIGLEISDPEWIKYVFVTNGANWASGIFLGSGFFKQAVGENGLVVVNGETHKTYKKLLSPAYKLSTLKKSMPVVHLGGERMVNLFKDYWRRHTITSGEHIGASEIEVKYLFNKTTIDIAILFLLGYDIKESCSWEVETFPHYLWRVLDRQSFLFTALGHFMNSSIVRSFCQFSRCLPYGGFVQVARLTNKMNDMVETIIEKAVTELQRKQDVDDTSNQDSFRPLLQYMLDTSSGIRLSRQEIHDIIVTFIIGGHETATLSLTYTLYELCKHPDYQTRLRNEVIKGFEELNQKVDWDDIMSMKKFPLLNAVVKESLRLYPPVPWLPRTSVEPDIIDGHHVPANTLVMLMMFEMQRNADIWPDPDEFKPERFLEPDDTIPWHAWLPFGDGQHKCIGYQFGLTEASYLLAMMVKNFRFSYDPTIDYRQFAYISLNSKPEMKFFITPL